MKIILKDSDPTGEQTQEFNNIHDFLFENPMYGQLLSGGREKHRTTITIDVHDYPATYTIEVYPDEA